jgi:hypothetical protein
MAPLAAFEFVFQYFVYDAPPKVYCLPLASLLSFPSFPGLFAGFRQLPMAHKKLPAQPSAMILLLMTA